jgi:hypothetical protein
MDQRQGSEQGQNGGGRAYGSSPGVHFRAVGELKCYLCGRLAGVIEAGRLPFPIQVVLRTPGEGKTNLVADWRRLRCAACGAGVYLDEVHRVRDHIEPDRSQVWGPEPPRTSRRG